MIATLARLVSGQPEGVLRHLALYGTLVQAETSDAAQRLARRIALGVAALLLLCCGVTLAGVAGLLAAAGLVAAPPAVYWVIPGLPLAAAMLAGWLAARAEPVPAYTHLRQQLAIDVRWLARGTEAPDESAATTDTAHGPGIGAGGAARGPTDNVTAASSTRAASAAATSAAASA